MNTQLNSATVAPPASIRTYWVLDGDNKAYCKREQIKGCGGYFDKNHSSWCIDNPSENAISFLKVCGLVIQFRRFKDGR